MTVGRGEGIASPACVLCRSPASAGPRSSTSSTCLSRYPATASDCSTSVPSALTLQTPPTACPPTDIGAGCPQPGNVLARRRWSMEGGPVDEFFDVTVQRPLLEEFQVEV